MYSFSSFSSMKNFHCPLKILVQELGHFILKLQGQLKPKVARASQNSCTTEVNPQQTTICENMLHIAIIAVQLRILKQGDFTLFT